MENNFEIRYLTIRANNEDTEDRTIKGTSIVFNSPSEDLGGFIEEISPDAVNTEFLNQQDILMLYNHKKDSGVLARSNKGTGTLKYSIDATGVNFEFKAKNTALGNEVLESVRCGDLDKCSFAFRVADGGEKWENIGNNMYKRTITKFELIRDFSIVLDPAYSSTSTTVRSLELFKAEEQRKLDEAKAEDEKRNLETIEAEAKLIEDRNIELVNYYSKYHSILEKYK